MMRRLPSSQREPIARFRALLLGFTLAMAGANAIVIGLTAGLQPQVRVAGILAAATLAGWFYWGYRRQRFPAFDWLVEGVLLFVVASASPLLPLRALGVFYIGIQFRSLDVPRRRLPLLLLAYAVARVASLAYAPTGSAYAAFSLPVAMQIIVLVIIAIISNRLATASAQQSVVESSLRRSEERYRLLSAVTRDVVYDWNLETNEVEWSESLRSVFGHLPPSGGSGGQWWVDLIHPEDRTPFEHAIRAFVANPLDNTDGVRYRVQRADGTYATVSATMLVEQAQGKATRVIGSIRDISTEEELQEQLRESRKMEAVGQLAGGVAHDFNNLLTVIGGHVYMLQHNAPPTALLERHLDGITAASQRAAALTRQLLAFSRKQILKPEVLDLNAVIDDVGRLITPLLGENIRFVTMLDPQIDPVLADSGQIGQVLINLALNARDAMPNGGTLVFETSRAEIARDSEEARRTKLPRGEYVRLTARDTGAGMDAATVARAFEPFFTTKPRGKGTGLGLATAYGIIRQSAGDIWVDSVPGVGSTFTMLLPVTSGEVAARALEKPLSNVGPSAAGDGVRVLLVEDDDGVRAFAEQLLVDGGFHVLAARDGLDGLAVAQRNGHVIDLVVTDVVMPEMGGPAMIEHLRRRIPDLRVLYMTGYTDDLHISSNLRATAEALIEKPFVSAAFIAAVERVRARDHGVVRA